MTASLTSAAEYRQPARWNALREQAEQSARRFPPLLVQAERIAQTVAFGVHGRRVVGPGDSFWQFRRYEPEDSVTAIDWRQSAKSQHVFIREREWEAAQSVWMWRDGSPSMTYRSSEAIPTKLDRASVLLLAAGSLLVRGGERVGFLRPGGETSTGRLALRKLAAQLSDPASAPGDTPAPFALPRHSRVLAAGDFFVPLEAFERMVASFAGAGAKGHLVQVVDPAEEDFPFQGRIRFEHVDGLDGSLFGRVQSLRVPYRQRFDAHREALMRVAARYGWTFQTHRTDKPPETALLAIHRVLGEDHRRASGRRG